MHIQWRAAGRAGAFVLVAAAAGAALAACSGKKGAQAAQAPGQTATPVTVETAGIASPATDAGTGAPDGRQIYQRCATCHQPTGLGIPGAFPPLAGSEWASAADAGVPIRIVLHGLEGPITVKGQKFNSAMPAYGTNQPMNDAEVAAVLTYVRSSWGNKGGAVTAAAVHTVREATAARKTAWKAADLEPLLHAAH